MIYKKINKIVIYLIIFLIKFYQMLISPILKVNCRYLPTCSEYTIEVFKEYGLILGFYYSFKRISKCHPLGGSGYDPIPKKIKREL